MDEQKTNIEGDFSGQLANGNINNYHSQERTRLTAAEVWPIKQKGKELIELSNLESVEVWGRLKEIFGEGHNELYKDQEKAAKAILDLWIEKITLTNEISDLEQNHPETHSELVTTIARNGELTQQLAIEKANAKALSQQINKIQADKDHVQETLNAERQRAGKQNKYSEEKITQLSAACSNYQRRLSHTRIGFVSLGIVALLFGAFAAWLYSQHRQAQNSLATSTALNQLCQFEQKKYQPGQTLTFKNGTQLECKLSGENAAWFAVKKISMPPKKKPQDAVEEDL